MSRQQFIGSFICAIVFVMAVLLPGNAFATVQKERITIAYSKDSVPFHFTDDASGLPAGIIIDIWRLWSQKTGIAVDFKEAGWDETLNLVGKGEADAHAGLFFSPERDRFLDFGTRLTQTDTHCFTHVTIPLISRVEDLLAYRVGVLKKDYVEMYLQQRLGRENLVSFPDYERLMNALKKGDIKVFAADTPTGIHHLDRSGLLHNFQFVSEKPLYARDWLVAAKQGNSALINTINAGMFQITKEEKNKIKRRWSAYGRDNAKALIISIDRDYSPLTFINAMGEPSGFFVDLWRLWSQKTGRQIQFRASSWAETMEGLRAGVADIHSGLSFSEERAGWVDFSTQIYESSSRIYFRTGDNQPETISGYDSEVIGAITGAYHETALSKAYPKIRMRSYATTQQMIEALLKGEVKAIIEEKQSMSIVLDRLGLRGEISSRPERLFPSAIHAGVQKGNRKLLTQINQGLSLIPLEQRSEMETRWVADPNDRFYKTGATSFTLTADEVKWLDAHPKIRIGIMNAWPPMNFVDAQQKPMGIGVDYITLLNEQLNGRLSIVPGPFKENMEDVKARRLDALMDITPKKEREPFFEFTQPYLTIPHVFVGRKNAPYIQSEKDLSGKTVALERGFYNIKYFKTNYPDVSIREYGSTSEALGAVSKGEAHAYAGNRAVITYLIEKELLANLSVQGRMKKEPAVLSIGVRKDWPVLAGILDRALKSVSREQIRTIHRKWLGELEQSRQQVDLTAEQTSWIAENPIIKVAATPDWPPFEFREQGRYLGLHADILRLVAQKCGLIVEPVFGKWSDLQEELENGRLDMCPGMRENEARKQYLLFTDPVSETLEVIIARNADTVRSAEDLSGRKVAVEKGYANESYIEEHYPKIELYPVDNTLQALKAVITHKADAYIGTQAVALYLLKKHLFTGLKVAAFFEEQNRTLYKFGVTRQKPLLRDILQKGLDSISDDEMARLKERWFSVKESRPRPFLSHEERIWLDEHPVLSVLIDANWAPVEFRDDQNRYHGISLDYLNKISALLDVEFEVAAVPSWKEGLEAVQNGRINLAASVARNKERDTRFVFTTPYVSMPINIFAGEEVGYIGNLSRLDGKRVAIVDGYAVQEWMEINHPEIILVPVKSIPDAFKLLITGKVYAFVGNVVTGSHYAGKLRHNQIRIVGETPYKNLQCMAVGKENAILAGILQKAINAIPMHEKDLIYNRWVSVKYEHEFDYSLMWKIMVPSACIILLFFYWNRQLKREVAFRQKAQAELRLDEERLEALLKLSRMEESDEARLMEHALDECVRLTGSRIGYIHFVNPDQKTLNLCAWSREVLKECTAQKNFHYPISQAGIWADCVRNKKPAVHNDYPGEPGRQDLPKGHVALKRHMSIPVMDGDKAVLVAGVGNKTMPYDDADVRQLTLFMQNMWGIIKEKRAEAIRSRYEFIVNSVKDAMSFINADYVYEAVNETFCSYFNRSRTEVIGRTIAQIWSEQDFEKYIRPNIDRCFNGHIVSYELAIPVRGEKERHCHVSMYPFVNDHNEVTHVVVVTKDIEERIQTEQELKRNMEELAMFNNLAIGREEKMIQLKQEINELLVRLGRSKKYTIVE